jgi:hypothetical protein
MATMTKHNFFLSVRDLALLEALKTRNEASGAEIVRRALREMAKKAGVTTGA